MRFVPRLAILALMLALPPVVTPAGGQEFDLDGYTRLDPSELPETYRRWLEEEVLWIITTREREVFLRLAGDAHRDAFIDAFWKNRDPSPGTPRNEYREMHYERFEYATDNFGRETPRPGWRTDRGRVWILLGKPQSTTRLPNTTQAVPSEVWFYSVDPALRMTPFFYLIFFRDSGMGEYRLYSPSMDGPMALLNPSGQLQVQRGTGGLSDMTGGGRGMAMSESGRAIQELQRVDAELASAAGSLIPGEGGYDASPLRSEMVLSRIFDLPNVLMPRPDYAYAVLAGVAESEVRFETLPLQADAVALLDPTGLPFVHFVTRTIGDKLNLNNYDENYYVTFEVSSALRDAQLRMLEVREPRLLQADLDSDTARDLRGGPAQYIDRMPALPGSFMLDVTMENNVSREFARLELPVTVPAPNPSELGASRPLLLVTSQDLGSDWTPFSEQYPFQVGPRVMVPTIEGPFPEAGELQVYRQIWLPETATEPFLQRVAVVDGQGVVRIEKLLRVDSSMRTPFGAVDLIARVDLACLAPGRYEVEVSMDSEATPTRLPMRIVAADEWHRPFVHALRQSPPGSLEVALARARQLRTLGRTDEAIDVLAAALVREPDSSEAVGLQLDLLREAGRLQELEQLLAPHLAAAPNDPELLLQAAEASAALGKHFDAIRYYERARIGGAAETPELLNALAAEYWAEGNADKARALLEQSLQLNPEQPQIRLLLEEVVTRDVQGAAAGAPR